MEVYIQSPNRETFRVDIIRSSSLDGYDYVVQRITGNSYSDSKDTIANGQIKEIDLKNWRLKNPHKINCSDDEELAIELGAFLEDNYDRYVGYYD